MKKHQVYALALVLFATGLLFAQTNKKRKNMPPTTAPHRFHVSLPPDAIQWKPFFEGAELAVLSGDQTKAGSPYVIRIKARDGLKVPPHWHPFDENVTVISGTWIMGMGEKFDLSVAQEFPAGAYLLAPKNAPHFGLCKGQTILQVHGIGPFVAYFVNPEDDVFKKPK
jgi:quercetin dioxygenase-like cupin family protein